MSVSKIGPHPSNKQVRLALVHHANQYVITKGYADREGVRTILGLRQHGDRGPRRGLLPLLQMHLSYAIPLNLHLSGTLIEALTWHCPESFLLVKRLREAGLLELVGSAFSQNIMPYFSARHNLRQLNEELWLFGSHLDWDLNEIRTFWVPERVWDTEKLAPVLGSRELLNGGYHYVLLDDRLVFPAGERYEGSERQRFDAALRPNPDAFKAWEIAGGGGLVLIPFSKRLRYLVPPPGPEALRKIGELLAWLGASGGESAVAVYADDLEKAAGVGGWDHAHESRYEHFLRWLSENRWVTPVLIGDWARGQAPAGRRRIEPGTFYELARQWGAGEDYRGWIDDPRCAEQRAWLQQAEQALTAAESRGADRGLLEMGWKHLLHCSYETMWHNPHDGRAKRLREPLPLEGWAAALSSHARSCLVFAEAAEWFTRRDRAAHAELKDIDRDGETELVLKNDRLFAVVSPQRGGRLVYLFDLTGGEGRVVIGNVSDDWNLQQELNRYMDQPRNHPGALADVGHEHDCYRPIITQAHGEAACAVLRNVEDGSALGGLEKQLRLSAGARQVSVKYVVPPGVWRLSTELSLSPDYYRLLRDGHRGVEARGGPDWRGWANGPAQVWVRIDRGQSTLWDEPYQPESGHSFNLRASSFSPSFNLEIGVGEPPPRLGARDEAAAQVPSVADPHFMRRYFERRLTALKAQGCEVRECRVRSLSRHHDRLTLEYRLLLGAGDGEAAARSLVGVWREDERTRTMYQLLERLWRAGFDGRDGLGVPQPLVYSSALRLLVTERAPGRHLRQWVENPKADWTSALGRVAAWLAKLHNCPVTVRRKVTRAGEIAELEVWREELTASARPWLAHEKERIAAVVAEIIRRLRAGQGTPPCLVHGDFHPENILVRGRSVTVIDFEHCAVADPASDLGYLIGQIDVQADRHWSAQGGRSPFDAESLKRVLLASYARTRPPTVSARVPLYQAWTYLKHLLYTLRMKGAEDPRLVTLWLDKAAACLETDRRAARQDAA